MLTNSFNTWWNGLPICEAEGMNPYQNSVPICWVLPSNNLQSGQYIRAVYNPAVTERGHHPRIIGFKLGFRFGFRA